MRSADPEHPDHSQWSPKVSGDGTRLIQRKTLTNQHGCETVRDQFLVSIGQYEKEKLKGT